MPSQCASVLTLLKIIRGNELLFLSVVLELSLGLEGLSARRTPDATCFGMTVRRLLTGLRTETFLSNELMSDSESVCGKAAMNGK